MTVYGTVVQKEQNIKHEESMYFKSWNQIRKNAEQLFEISCIMEEQSLYRAHHKNFKRLINRSPYNSEHMDLYKSIFLDSSKTRALVLYFL